MPDGEVSGGEMIPNTTQTPNCIFDYWMSRLKGGELKVLLAVVRHTIGWLEDPETGRRREKDHITHAKLVEMTGTSGNTITRALAKLIDELGIVEALDEEENLLNNPEARRKVGQNQKPIYYRIPLEKLHPGGYRQNGDRSEETYPQNQDRSEGTYRQNGDSHLPPKSGTESKERKDLKKEKTSAPKPRFPAEDYRQVEKAYSEIKGIEPNGDEWGPIQRDIKLMFKSGNTPQTIIDFMRALEDSPLAWTDTWTIKTVRMKLPEWRADKLNLGANGDADRIRALRDDIAEIDRYVEDKLKPRLAKLEWRDVDVGDLTVEEAEDMAHLQRLRRDKMQERERLVRELGK